MTTEEKLITLVKRLHAKTKAGEIRWEQTTANGVFQTAFPSYTVKLAKRGADYSISILDEMGTTLESSDDAQLAAAFPERSVYQTMRELYDMARRVALGVNEALDSLLGELG
jgi:hypothetical protein